MIFNYILLDIYDVRLYHITILEFVDTPILSNMCSNFSSIPYVVEIMHFVLVQFDRRLVIIGIFTNISESPFLLDTSEDYISLPF